MSNRFANLSNRDVVLILMGVALLSALLSAGFGAELNREWLANVFQGLVTEMAGAVATF